MAWNDPQWGKKNDGPPDLDEIWRKFNSRLNRMLGNKPDPVRSITPGTITIVLALLIAIWLGSGFYVVDTGQRGVVLRFGEYIETVQPGPGWHIPWPVESVELVNMQQMRTVEIGYRDNAHNRVPKESLMLTADANIVDLQFAVQYSIRNPENYLFANRSPDEAVRQVAESVMNAIVGRNKMDYVLYQGRSDMADQAAKRIQQILDQYHAGIGISQVTLQNVQPPQEVQSAFDDAVRAGQDRERLKNEAQAYANDVIPKARGVAARLQEEAAGYKQTVIADAQGEADRFSQILAQYSKAPAVTRERMYIDMMQQVLSSSTKVLEDGRKGSSQTIYLPLDKLMQPGTSAPVAAPASAAPAIPAAPAPAPAAAPQPPAAPDTTAQASPVPQAVTVKPDDAAQPPDDSTRSRDFMRNRNREERP